VGKVSKAKKKDTGWGVGGEEKTKFPKKTKIKEKNWEGRGKNKIAKTKLRLRLIKGKKTTKKKINLGWHKDRKKKLIIAPSIHAGALMGVGSFWPAPSTRCPLLFNFQ